MTLALKYNDEATIVEVTSGVYGSSKIIVEQEDVNCIFLQDTNMVHANHQDGITADAIMYVDFSNQFIVDNFNRLEGMYVMIPLFGSSNNMSWYKIESCTIHRDHLLQNVIDNIELALKKTTPIAGVS
jgi:hypothetical protein